MWSEKFVSWAGNLVKGWSRRCRTTARWAGLVEKRDSSIFEIQFYATQNMLQAYRAFCSPLTSFLIIILVVAYNEMLCAEILDFANYIKMDQNRSLDKFSYFNKIEDQLVICRNHAIIESNAVFKACLGTGNRMKAWVRWFGSNVRWAGSVTKLECIDYWKSIRLYIKPSRSR